MARTTVSGPTEHINTFEEPCRLLRLPDEVKLEIVKHVHRKRDLYNFSLACRSLEDMTLSKLYEAIDLDIPCSETLHWNESGLPAFRPYVLQNMRELTVRNGISDEKNPIYHKRRRSDANSVEGYVGQIFEGVPRDRLKTFSFQHQTPMSNSMVDSLTRKHGRGLRHLQCCELELLDSSDIALPSNLQSLECRSVLSGEAITKLISNNKRTLQTLSLGQDKYLLQRYRERRIGFLNNIPQPLSTFHSMIDLSTLPDLKTLSLSGLDLAPLTPQTVQSALCLGQLESLTLESCPNTSSFLDVLTSTFAHMQTTLKQAPCLKKFSFRHEFFTNPIRDSLVRFLTSFKGLTSLSLLVENTTFTMPPSTFLTPHGPTLQTLVLESRIQPREHLQIDTSRPFGPTTRPTGPNPATTPTSNWLRTINDITTLCPQLLELGTAFPWTDTSVLTSSTVTQSPTHLRNLRTLHIRNYPSTPSCTPLTATQLANHATQLLTQLNLPVSSPLETLAIGPTLYCSRWRLGAPTTTTTPSSTTQPTVRPVHTSQLSGSTTPPQTNTTAITTTTTTTSTSDSDSETEPPTHQPKKAKRSPFNPPPHLCTHYFSVQAGVVLEAVGDRYMEEVRGCGIAAGAGANVGLGGVFAGVWLR